MSSSRWFPEPIQPYGGFVGEGARRVLGKPRLDPLTVLVRETAQNTWDARRPDAKVVDFSIRALTLEDQHLHALRHDLFTDLPPAGIELGQVLDREQVAAMLISDRGTVGLSGPTRADLPVSGRSDFVDLVFNMGQPRDVPGGGGTYGFGKTITYIVSEASAAVLYTRTRVEAELESRLIGVAVGGQYQTDTHRFTGRHWWGRGDGESIGPLIGADADQLATQLGFNQLEGEDTGLSLMILAPRLESRSPKQAMTFIASALLWNFWPKMISRHAGDGRPPMTFEVGCDGEPVEIPDPEQHPPLGAYVQALRAIHAVEDGRDIDPSVEIVPLRAQRPNRQLGLVAFTRVPRRPRRRVDEGASSEDDDEAPASAAFAGNSHHVALMRRAELVVKYLPGPELPAAHIEWAGVFLNDEDIDTAFADAEPPTHDEWQPGMVEDKSRRRLVTIAMREIQSAMRRMFAPAPAAISDEDRRSAVVIGNALGGLLASAKGTAPGKKTREVGPRGKRGIRLTIVEIETRPALVDGAPGAELEFRVEADGEETEIVGSASAAVDENGSERDPPAGASVPEVVGFRRPTERNVSTPGTRLAIASNDSEPWVLVVRNRGGTAVALEVRAAAQGSAQ